MGRRWFGAVLVGVGPVLFGVSQQRWQEWGSFDVIAAGIVLTLQTSITGQRS